MQDFQKLRVWHAAHALGLKVDRLLRQFPRRGCGTLKSQLSAAADSIASTIVEGCGAASQREFARFLDMSIKSTSETQHHVINARDRGYLHTRTSASLLDEIVAIRKMLYKLRAKVLASLDG